MPRGQATAPKNPVLVSSLGYRKAVVRHCIEQLRELEGRLEQTSGPRWELQLHNCEDLAGVAKLIIMLQRRVDLPEVDNVWLEKLAQLPTAELDERAVEMTRHVKHRLHVLRQAMLYPVSPATMLGATIVRHVDCATAVASQGRVVEHDDATGFRVLYADGDAEDLTFRELGLQLACTDPDATARTRGTRNLPKMGDRDGHLGDARAWQAAANVELSVRALIERHHAANSAPVTVPPLAKLGAIADAAEANKCDAEKPIKASEGRKAKKAKVQCTSDSAADPHPGSSSSAVVKGDAEAGRKAESEQSHEPGPKAPLVQERTRSRIEMESCVAPAGGQAPPPLPLTSLPEYGLTLLQIEAAAAGPTRRLPRELRNLAMPDRDWNVAVPFFTTSAKTREQFSSSADTLAEAAAAREMHEQRAAETAAQQEMEDLEVDAPDGMA